MLPAIVWGIRNATLAARQRTGDFAIGTRVKAGQFQVTRVTYPKGKRGASVVEPLSEYMSAESVITFLATLGV